MIQSGDGFYVAELVELTPARPLTLAEATPAIEARLRQVRAEEALRTAADAKIAALREALAAGKPFAEVFGEAMLGYALPLTAVTLVIIAGRAWHKQKA